MACCFSTRASVAAVLTTHPCVSRCLRVKHIVVVKMATSSTTFWSAFPWMQTIDPNFTDHWSTWSTNWQWVSIGSDNCLSLNKRQAIIWNNMMAWFNDAYMHHSASMRSIHLLIWQYSFSYRICDSYIDGTFEKSAVSPVFYHMILLIFHTIN